MASASAGATKSVKQYSRLLQERQKRFPFVMPIPAKAGKAGIHINYQPGMTG